MIDRRLVHKYWWVGGYCLAHQYLHIILPKEGEGRERKNPPKNHESNLYMLWVAMLLKCQSKRIYIFVEFQQLRICHLFWAILPPKKKNKKKTYHKTTMRFIYAYNFKFASNSCPSSTFTSYLLYSWTLHHLQTKISFKFSPLSTSWGVYWHHKKLNTLSYPRAPPCT